ncbi:hypothetical protein AZE42_13712 [Rhizopogon vesiculosus]|uniref:Uncharacterized protein n=1 Tax=Rhizopogon vesiculosus TaxID=180088 RepID=A0A1J8Q8I4_9AGAM|nr:hypothetical protein AZE42_13712 [Rhizopogon vesiculosus]
MTAKKLSGGSAQWVILPDPCTDDNRTAGVDDRANEEMEWEVSDELRHNEFCIVC